MTDRTMNKLFVSRNDKVCDFGGGETTGLSNARHRRRLSRQKTLLDNCKEKQFGLLCRGRKSEHISSSARYRCVSRAIYPYRFGFDLNKSEVKQRRRNTTTRESGPEAKEFITISDEEGSLGGEVTELIRRRDQSFLPVREENSAVTEVYLFVIVISFIYWEYSFIYRKIVNREGGGCI